MKNIIEILVKNRETITLVLSLIGAGYAVWNTIYKLIWNQFNAFVELYRYSNNIEQQPNSFMMYVRLKISNNSRKSFNIMDIALLDKDKNELLCAASYGQVIFKGHEGRVVISTEYPIHISGGQGAPVLSSFTGKSDPKENLYYAKLITNRGDKIVRLETKRAKGIRSEFMA